MSQSRICEVKIERQLVCRAISAAIPLNPVLRKFDSLREIILFWILRRCNIKVCRQAQKFRKVKPVNLLVVWSSKNVSKNCIISWIVMHLKRNFGVKCYRKKFRFKTELNFEIPDVVRKFCARVFWLWLDCTSGSIICERLLQS